MDVSEDRLHRRIRAVHFLDFRKLCAGWPARAAGVMATLND
jgi:hypothetical protein